MKAKDDIISNLKKVLEELDITSSLRLPIIQTIEYLQEEPVSESVDEEWKRYVRSEEYLSNPLEGSRPLAHHFANWQKEQMMKDAVKVSVNGNDDGWLTLGYLPECECELRKGDEVKVIIIKEN